MAEELFKRPPDEIIEARIKFQTRATLIGTILLCVIWAVVDIIVARDALVFFYLGYLLGTFTIAAGFMYLKLMRKKIRADPYSGPEEAIVAAFKAAGFCVPFYVLSWPFGGLPPFSGAALAIAFIYYFTGREGLKKTW
jgi:hypothetical protein